MTQSMTPKEHAARALFLKNNKGEQLWFDAATNSYRPRSPEGSAYKYSGCLDADTLRPLKEGEALRRQQNYTPFSGSGGMGWKGISNTVSNKRLGLTDD